MWSFKIAGWEHLLGENIYCCIKKTYKEHQWWFQEGTSLPRSSMSSYKSRRHMCRCCSLFLSLPVWSSSVTSDLLIFWLDNPCVITDHCSVELQLLFSTCLTPNSSGWTDFHPRGSGSTCAFGNDLLKTWHSNAATGYSESQFLIGVDLQ